MNKEKEIEEMVEIARKYSENFANTPYYKGVYTDMEAIYEAGYRKADKVRKETAKEIWKDFKLQRNHFDDWEWEVVKLICRTYGIEVDE